ncbi:MAG: relaxase MobL [Clostridiales Family XIII bacterium]|jgi:TPR repeat protein|nr:relaxase MobL [Clostridiales Family XIII bacterium]
MAKIILKSPYLKPSEKRSRGGFIRYVATRSGAERPEDSKRHLPATHLSKEVIGEIITEFPDTKDLYEYGDYIKNPTRGNAGEFIKVAAEVHNELFTSRRGYVDYIATRPGAQMLQEHGLFTDAGVPVILDRAAEEIDKHEGNVWCHIVSLRREDAARLGFDNISTWQNLLRSKRDLIAQNMKISPGNFRWYAAFHNEGHHPHVHMVCYSADPKEPWLSKKGIENIKAGLAHEIFKQDLLQIYEKQTEHRDALRGDSRSLIADIVSSLNQGDLENDAVAGLLVKLSERLKNTSGKKVYGYLKPDVKALVCRIVDELAKDERIAKLYDLWYEQREEVIRTYTDKMPDRIPLSQNPEFKTIRNAVITEAENISLGGIITEDRDEDFWYPANDIFEQAEDAVSYSGGGDFSEDDYRNDEGLKLYRQAKELLDDDSPAYDPKEGMRLMHLSADEGYEWAVYRLGKNYLYGLHTVQDVPLGLAWLNKSVDGGNRCAQSLMGRLYLHGRFVEQDYIRAERLLEDAAGQEDAIAAYALAKMHLTGIARYPNNETAISLLDLSAKGDYEWAQYTLGKIYTQGILTEKNMIRAEELLIAAATPQKQPWRPKDEPVRGNEHAQYLLGKLYLADDVIPKDAAKAVYWLGMSAEQNNQFAQYLLGKMNLFGIDVERNARMGIALLAASAAQGNIYAALLLKHYEEATTYLKVNAGLSAFRLLGHAGRVIENKIADDRMPGGRMHTDSKLLQKINEKKRAQGLRL